MLTLQKDQEQQQEQWPTLGPIALPQLRHHDLPLLSAEAVSSRQDQPLRDQAPAAQDG